MTEREALEQKSFSDLVEIAVAFNLTTREEANSKTSGELIALIANEEPAKTAAPKKKNSTKKATTKNTSKDSSKEETKEVKKETTAKKTPSRKPKAKTSEVAPVETPVVVEQAVAEAIPEVSEVVEKTIKNETPKKKTTKAKKEKVESTESKDSNVEDKPAVETKKPAKAEKTTKKKSSSKSVEAKESAEASAPAPVVEVTEVVTESTAPVETKVEADAEPKVETEVQTTVEEAPSKATKAKKTASKSKTSDKTKAKKTKSKETSPVTDALNETDVASEVVVEESIDVPSANDEQKSEEVKSESSEVSEPKSGDKKNNKKNNNRRNSKAKKDNSKKNPEEMTKTPSEVSGEVSVTAEGEAASANNDSEAKENSGDKVNDQKFQNNKKQKKPIRGRKRTLSFGTQENGEVVVTEIESTEIPIEGAAEEKAPEEPVVVEPEIQYIEVEGVLSIGSGDKGDFNGFIHKTNYLPGDEDAFVQGQLIRRMGLRRGDYIKGLAVAPKGKEKYAPLKKILSVNGIELTEDTDLDVLRKRKRFESLTAIYPDQKLRLETDFGKGKNDISTRIIDLFSPIGKGQRGMIVSPPKAGKTVLLKKVANAIKANNPNCHLIVLLIDERPEEVTDMQRSINGEVVYSTFDKKPENHVRVTELVLERAMRLVEIGEDVVILLDSMTRLARAYNLTINPTGRTLSGGLDPGSLYGPKRFFGAARNIENGGSLTIIATALIETGSRMDEVIFEEFKGTGNMEVTLDRKLADRRVFPAIAVDKSGTRREDLLLTPEELEAIWLLRKRIADVDTTTATDAVINFMQKTTNNNSFVLSIKKSFAVDD